ncbi:hypothetical protein BS054_25735 [Vibrio parahaemolyticus]|nr:hypothetical protein [Vibrio parahaemolyticus]
MYNAKIKQLASLSGVKMAFPVLRNNTWANDGTATKEFFEAQGATVKPSKIHGDYDVFLDGKHVAWIFNNKEDQIKFLTSIEFLIAINL